jgi:multicomponent Na+:H+ antiporter subunit G
VIAILVESLIAFLLLLGASLTFISALGLFRLPDLFTRMHAASKAGTAGSGLLLLAVAMHADAPDVWVKCLLAVVFFFLTAPVSAHLLAKAAVRWGEKLPPPEGEKLLSIPALDAANPAASSPAKER